jgi:recombinational DNA repair protein RecR
MTFAELKAAYLKALSENDAIAISRMSKWIDRAVQLDLIDAGMGR